MKTWGDQWAPSTSPSGTPSALFGFDAVDYWNRTVDERALRNEIGKLDQAAKRELATRLLAEADEAEPTIPPGR